MEHFVSIHTEAGMLEGRDAIFLNKIIHNGEREIILFIEVGVLENEKRYEVKFSDVIFISCVELDFDKRTQMESFAIVNESEKIKEFKLLGSSKLIVDHKHYYVRTYDTVFEIVASNFELSRIN